MGILISFVIQRNYNTKNNSDPNPQRDSGRLIEFIAYSLIPNHFHFLIKQKFENGISKFMQKFSMGYTNYFNIKYNRSGYLFQGKFKAIHIKTDGNLSRLSAYINGNPEIHKIARAEKWAWSSYQDYLNLRNGNLCNKKEILNQFTSVQEYKNFAKMVISDSIELKDELKLE